MKKKKNPIYGDSLKVERNDSLFFVPFHFQLLFSFAFHLNCMVSSFEFLLGNLLFAWIQLVSTLFETVCFKA